MWRDIIHSFLAIGLELTALFLVVSFAINLLQGFIPFERLERFMFSRNLWVGAAVSLMIAFITPFCSCSTIPIVVTMLNKKMRFAFVLIFLFASPLLDPTILTLMIAVLGWEVAIVYTVVTSICSVLIGFALEVLGFQSAVKRVMVSGMSNTSKKIDVRAAIIETLHLMKTVYPYLLIGALIGSVIHGAIPSDWISTYLGGNQWWLVPVTAIIGIPLYIRLSTMIPISQIMIAKGMAVAPVMALMISSTGASLPEIALLNSIFHKRLVAAFVLSVFTMSVFSGLLFYVI